MTVEESESIEVALLLEAIRTKYGCDLRGYARESLHRRLRTALARLQLGHLGELQHALLHDAHVFAELLDQLTVHVTQLFRDPEFYRSFRASVVPMLRTYPLLRIWHAGCATGEEAYALAMLLSEEGLYERAQIYATDLSGSAIERARSGRYGEAQLARFAQNYAEAGGRATLGRYFEVVDGSAVIRAELKRNVYFFQHNLVSDGSFAEMHVVFCRNVLIYLSEPLQREVLRGLAASLVPGGFLCLGQSEQPKGLREDFAVVMPEERIYRRIDAKRCVRSEVEP